MNFKKKVAGVLLATMCAALFAGCGGDTKSADSTSGQAVKKYKLNTGMLLPKASAGKQ